MNSACMRVLYFACTYSCTHADTVLIILLLHAFLCPPVDAVCGNLKWRQEIHINMNRNKVDETQLICMT